MWLLLSAIAGILFFLCLNFTEKLSREDGRQWGAFIMANLVVCSFFTAFVPLHLPAKFVACILLSGMAYAIGSVPFYKTYGKLTPLSISIISLLGPAFVLLLAWIILGEGMTITLWLCFFLILAGSVICALGDKRGGRNSAAGLLLLMTAIILVAVYQIGTKYSGRLGMASIADVFVLSRIGMVLGDILLLCFPVRKKMMRLFSMGKRGMLYVLNEMMWELFSAAVIAALLMQKQDNASFVSLVYSAISQMCMFAFAFLHKEKELKWKLAGSLVAMLGLVVLALNK